MKGQEVKTLDERADERRGFDGGAPARRSRDGDALIVNSSARSFGT